MTAHRNDAERRSATPGADSTPTPGSGDSIPATSAPRPDPPSATPLPESLAGLPAELRDHPTYEVQRELGRGGMGVVYLARNKVMNRLEVLKVLQDRLAGRPELLTRFVNEVQMAAVAAPEHRHRLHRLPGGQCPGAGDGARRGPKPG
jgi:serine/threonine protein kinase